MNFLENIKSILHEGSNNANNIKNGLNELYEQTKELVYAIVGGLAGAVVLIAVIWTLVLLFKIGGSVEPETRTKYKKTIGWVWLGVLIALVLFGLISTITAVIKSNVVA